MRDLDLFSIVVAGALGAVLFYLDDKVRTLPSTPTSTIAHGFALGALVQIGVRLTGVS